MELLSKHTRFRAYQLKTNGSSFSYWDGSHFTLCEARYNDDNAKSIWHELNTKCGKTHIDTLHITSWDADHCNPSELSDILKYLKPTYIEVPGHGHGSESFTRSINLLEDYEDKGLAEFLIVNTKGLSKLITGSSWEYNSIFWNKDNMENSNDDSTIKLFRSGCFNVLSLGDVESKAIAKSLLYSKIITDEVDVVILAHHGADNGFTDRDFLEGINPSEAITLCDWGNRYSHPDPSIMDLLTKMNIHKHTTKAGDIIIESIGDHRKEYKIWNYTANGNECEVIGPLTAKKYLHYYGLDK
jgi:competence protein ComEC